MYFRGPNTIIETRADYQQLVRMVLVAKLQYAMMLTMLVYLAVTAFMAYLFFSQGGFDSGRSITSSPYMIPGIVIGIGLLVVSSFLAITAFPKSGWGYILGFLIGLFIPIVYLIVIVALSGQVSSSLRQVGFTIGFLGASPSQIATASKVVKRGPPPPARQQ
ncbi:MAG: hypothetical protein KF784_14510 [Fimbriimonadaceae bacterium]|nr:hypothetical protein [Fimbriimonadaceae bacterium]